MVVLAYLLAFVVLLSIVWVYLDWRRFSRRVRVANSIVIDDLKTTAMRIGAAWLVAGLASGLLIQLVASPIGAGERNILLMRLAFALLCAGLLPVVGLIMFFTNVATLHFLYRDRGDTK